MKTEVPITEEETGESLHDKLADAGAKLCVETLKALEDGTASFEKQGESPTAYARMLDKKLGNIDWNDSAVRIERLVRGLNSWPSAYTHWNGKVMKIWRAKAEADFSRSPGKSVPGNPEVEAEPEKQSGNGPCSGKGSLYGADGRRSLQVYELQIPGKKRMETGAFLRGYALEEGTVFARE